MPGVAATSWAAPRPPRVARGDVAHREQGRSGARRGRSGRPTGARTPSGRCREAPCLGADSAASSNSSAIWIAFSAAPLRRLSLERYSARPFSTAGSCRMRPTRTSSSPAAAVGVGNSGRSRTRTLGASEELAASSGASGSSSSTQTASEWPTMHRHAHARGRDREVRQLEDLARLRAELRLLVRLVAFPRPVHHEVVVGRRFPASCSMRWAPAPETDWYVETRTLSPRPGRGVA